MLIYYHYSIKLYLTPNTAEMARTTPRKETCRKGQFIRVKKNGTKVYRAKPLTPNRSVDALIGNKNRMEKGEKKETESGPPTQRP